MDRTCQSFFTAAVLVTLTVSGCNRSEPLKWTASAEVGELPESLGQAVTVAVIERTGTAAEPVMLTEPDPSFDESRHLLHGQAVYMKRCYQCHGVNGDGNGPTADFMYPRPRDYTQGVFKFTSTPYGSKPRREDLIDTVYRGVMGTSMPSFDRIPKKDLEAVVHYVMVLAQRGELEHQLYMEAEAAEELEAEYVEEYVDDVRNGWKEAQTATTWPLSPQPQLDEARIMAGREAFLSKGCSKCHGEDGRGHTRDNIGKDSWGFPTRAADLTSGMLRGGQKPLDVYRRILNGINGSPMPGFRSALQSEPETIWNLVAYVLHVSNRRRAGEAITAGLMKPLETPGNAAFIESLAGEEAGSE